MNPRYKRGKWWTIRVPNPSGGSVAKSSRTRDPDVAKGMERMLSALYDQPKYHPILRAMLPRNGLKLPHVYGAWVAGGLGELLASLSDVDLLPYVDQWETHLEAQFGVYGYNYAETASGAVRTGDTTRQYSRQVRSLVEYAKGTLTKSRFTAGLVSPWLASLPVKTATRRRYYNAVSHFAAYLVTVGVLERSPLREMRAPPAGKPRDRHLSKSEWLRLIDWLPEPYRTAEVLAHLGIELGVIPTIRRRDVNLKERTVHARGTKRQWRDRLCYLYDWSLPYLTERCKFLTPGSQLVPASTSAIQVNHYAACEALGLKNYRFHDSRHSIAVWLVSAGAPFEVVAQQLGHKDTSMVQSVYGRFKPRTEDAARWARVAELRDEEEEREANG